MKIVLVDISKPMVEAWREVWADVVGTTPDVEIVINQGSIFETPCDAIVSPANSFGFMNGGIDYFLSEELGWHVMERVQEKIRGEFDSELLVGQSLIVPTDHADFPYLISAPTMRVPMALMTNTVMSANVYLAAKAIFIALKKNPQIQSVAIPGLGTGVGAVTPFECATKMKKAYEDFYLGQQQFPKTLTQASMKHWEETKVKTLNGEAI